jgi:CRP/FNR family transcriptional regulator, cyclic AMP receptor protein
MIMNSLCGLPIIDDCKNCGESDFFCSLHPDILRELNTCSHLGTYPEGMMLTIPGQKPRGVFFLLRGQIKISRVSREGKSTIVRIAAHREVVGLSSVIFGMPFVAKVETLSPCLMRFVSAAGLLGLARKHAEVRLEIARALVVREAWACLADETAEVRLRVAGRA